MIAVAGILANIKHPNYTAPSGGGGGPTGDLRDYDPDIWIDGADDESYSSSVDNLSRIINSVTTKDATAYNSTSFGSGQLRYKPSYNGEAHYLNGITGYQVGSVSNFRFLHSSAAKRVYLVVLPLPIASSSNSNYIIRTGSTNANTQIGFNVSFRHQTGTATNTIRVVIMNGAGGSAPFDLTCSSDALDLSAYNIIEIIFASNVLTVNNYKESTGTWTQIGTVTNGSATYSSADHSIALAVGQTATGFKGYFKQFVAFNRILTNDEITDVRAYLVSELANVVTPTPANVYLQWGQSNLEGNQSNALLPIELQGSLGSYRFWKSESSIADKRLYWAEMVAGQTTNAGTANEHGYTLRFAYNMAQAGYPSYNIIHGRGSTQLKAVPGSDWSAIAPGETDYYPELRDSFWPDGLEEIEHVLRKTPVLRGLIFCIGETDATNTDGSTWELEGTEFIRISVQDLQAMGYDTSLMRVCIIRLNDSYSGAGGYANVTAAQDYIGSPQFLIDNPDIDIAGATVINTDAFPQSGGHFTSDGIEGLGEAVADYFLPYVNESSIPDAATILGVGTSTAGTLVGSDLVIAAPIPAVTITEGMGIIELVGSKINTSRPNHITGFRRINTWTGATLNQGTDTGPPVGSLFVKEAVGGESGTVSITVPDANSAFATTIVVAKTEPYLNYEFTVGYHNTTNTTAYSARGHNPFDDIQENDLILVLNIVNTNEYSWSAQHLTQDSGTVFEETTPELFEASTNVGNDQAQFGSVFRATESGSGHLTFAATSSGSSSSPANPVGVTIFVKIRQSSTPQVWEPSGLFKWKARYVGATTPGGDGSAFADGHRISDDGPDAPTDRYQFVTKDGRTCLKLICDLTTGPNFRAETTFPLPIDPAYPVGTQIIQEIRFETDAWHNNPLQDDPDQNENQTKEFIITQNHTGTGGLAGPNHPIHYTGFAYAGQTGWDNFPGGAGSGVFMTSSNVDGVRNRFESVTWGANQTYRLRIHTKFDYASGDPCFKVWMNDTLLQADYVAATVATLPEDLGDGPGTGSTANVGGVPKRGLYAHGCKTQPEVDIQLAAGNNGLVMYYVSENIIVQYPDDPDYIADVTDNDNPIYDYLDTSDD